MYDTSTNKFILKCIIILRNSRKIFVRITHIYSYNDISQMLMYVVMIH